MSTEKEALGYINFDGLSGDNAQVEIRVPQAHLARLFRGQYVLLESSATGERRVYLARIVRGPFYVPDAVGKDSAFARASILYSEAVRFRPDYHGVCMAEVLGVVTDERALTLGGASTRPLPQAVVRELEASQIQAMLHLDGDLYLGELTGYRGVRVNMSSQSKAVLPRNVGIFGTVGSGKTNTAQVLIESAAASGWAVVVLDVEGEYVDMDRANSEVRKNPTLAARAERFGVVPRGVASLKVMHCNETEPSREDSQEFGLRFGNIDPHIFSEILELSAAQSEHFIPAYYDLAGAHVQQPRPRARRRGIAAIVAAESEPYLESTGVTLAQMVEFVETQAGNRQTQGRVSWQVLRRKLRRLERYRIFDQGNDLGDYRDLMQGGQVTVIDVSGSYNAWVNNIVISDVLRGIFRAKLADRNREMAPVMVAIEEAHTFVSRRTADKMETTLDVLRDISRRGRKRWISLCFVSQQPAHLPPEIYELCNTKVVHQTTGGSNLRALRESAGGVNESVWDEVPVLGQGRCLMISPQFRHPLLCDVRPCACDRRFTE